MGWVACGGSTLSGGYGGGLSGRLGGTAGGTLRGVWGLVMCCRLGGCTVARVCFMGGVGLRSGAPVVAKVSASCRMESMVWAPKWAMGAASAGFARASTRHLAASVAALVEDMAGMAPLCGKNLTVLVMRSPRVSGIKMWYHR